MKLKKMHLHQVTLDAETVTKLRALGLGNLSLGIRLAAATLKPLKSV